MLKILDSFTEKIEHNHRKHRLRHTFDLTHQSVSSWVRKPETLGFSADFRLNVAVHGVSAMHEYIYTETQVSSVRLPSPNLNRQQHAERHARTFTEGACGW